MGNEQSTTETTSYTGNDDQRNDDQGKTKTFYHYTDDAGAKGIEESGVIKESSPARGDAHFGGGVYLTTVPPSEDKCDIVANNYDSDTTRNNRFVENVVNMGRPLTTN